MVDKLDQPYSNQNLISEDQEQYQNVLNHELDQLKSQEQKRAPPVNYFKLYTFADKKDQIYMILGVIMAIINGVAMPGFSLLFGQVADDFNTPNSQDVVDATFKLFLWFIYLAIGVFIASFCMYFFCMTAGEKQGIRFREKYFEALLKQDVAWYDGINPNELSSKVANEAFAVQNAIAEKVATFVMTISTFIAGFIIAFIWGWQLSAVITASVPLIAGSAFLFVWAIQNQTTGTQKGYAQAAGFSEQALTAIKTVKSLNGEQFEVNLYTRSLSLARKVALKYSFYLAISVGLIYFTMFADYGLGFYFGAYLIQEQINNPYHDRIYTQGDVLAIFFSIVFAAFSLGQASPCLKAFSLGQEAGGQIFQTLERIPKIKIDQPNTKKAENIEGEIQLKDVQFTYPIRPQEQILKGITISIKKKHKTALVGPSGCGKSTIIQLIERFYDADQGEVIIDDFNIKEYNLKSLRQHIGYVGQEPVLFQGSIRENLTFGKIDATQEEMIDSLKKANAWDFVEKLDQKLDTYVGVGGSQFSGGQKQRIAIARAILKNPQILLLDEATSALDKINEAAIQKTLDEISEGRTTIVIAHRLSTIQNADNIIVIDDGNLVDQGTHKELMQRCEIYNELVKLQIVEEQEERKAYSKEFDSADQQVINMDTYQGANQPQAIGYWGQQTEKQDLLKDQDQVGSDIKLPEIKIDKKQSSIRSQNRQLSLRQKSKTQIKSSHHIDSASKIKEIEDFQKSKEEIQQEAVMKKKKQSELSKQMMKRLFNYNKPDKMLMIIGFIFAFLNGAIFPIIAIPLSKIIQVLAKGTQAPDYQSEVDFWCLMFLLVALAALISNFMQIFILDIVSHNLTKRIRVDTYNKILKKEITWFDQPLNNPGTLSSKLSVDAQILNGLTSNTIGSTIMALAAFISGPVISFVASWHLTLVSLGLSPLIVISAQVQAEMAQGFSSDTDIAYKESGRLITDSVTNIRTVYSFGNEELLLKNYSKMMDYPLKQATKKAFYAGLAFGFSQFVLFFVYGLTFYVGALFHDADNIGLSMENMFLSVFAIMFSAFGTGNATQFMPDFGKGITAANGIFQIIDSTDENMRNYPVNQETFDKDKTLKGDIIFKNVSFTYPTRDKLILENINLEIKSGHKVAFVGPSGCGKSTIMQLLLRFYDPQSGSITLDGIDLKDYDIHQLRKFFGVVSQEPVLFNGSVEYNIRYNSDGILMQDIKNASEQANALQFIEKNQFDDQGQQNLGSGFDRLVGPKGSQISGGQKQRIAIARAILKKPKIMLLDEATSALDSNSEKVVQESLNKIMDNKTSISIAHRISTIQNSNVIYVFDEGRVIEKGTYQELMNMKGAFYNLNMGIQHQ